jgi:hypothetical protein
MIKQILYLFGFIALIAMLFWGAIMDLGSIIIDSALTLIICKKQPVKRSKNKDGEKY